MSRCRLVGTPMGPGQTGSINSRSLPRAALLSLVTLAAGCGNTTFSVASGTEGGTTPPVMGVDAFVPMEAATGPDALGGEQGSIAVTGDLTFGAVSCGSAAAARKVTITNSGDVSATLSAALGLGESSAFLLDAFATTVPAKGSTEIAVVPRRVPSTSAVPGNYADTLTVTTHGGTTVIHTLPISESAQGAILSFSTPSIPFGSEPVGRAESSTFLVSNTGNLPAAVTLSLQGDAGSAFSTTASTGSPVTINPGDMLNASATFSPTTTGAGTETIDLVAQAGTVLCAPLPAPLRLSGTGENGGLAVSRSALSFGMTTCGTTAAAQTLTLSNTGNESLSWSASLANTSPSPYTLTPTSTGSLAAGQSVTLTITPSKIPAQSSIQSDFYADALTITTDVIGDEPHTVKISQSASGAILAFNPTELSFGDVPENSTSIVSFQVVNSGTVGASVTLAATGTGFDVSGAKTGAAAKMSEATFKASFAPGTSTATETGSYTLTTDAALCAPLPAALTASGTGSNGVVAYSPTTLSFGDQATSGFTACGKQAAAQTVTFTNSGNENYTLTPSLNGGASSPYTFTVSPANGVVTAGGGTATITVTPNAIPSTSAVPGSYGDTLSVSTTAAGDTSPHLITLTQNAYGAVLTGAPSTISFPGTPSGGESTVPVGITNSGNAPATLTWSNVAPAVFTFDANVMAPGGGVTTSPVAYFQPTAVASYAGSATFGVDATTILCQPIPQTNVSLSGAGTSGSIVSVTPAQVSFNMVPCGTSGGSDPLTIKNNSAATITWMAALPSGAAFTLSTPSSGSLTPGQSATVTVTSNTIPVAATTTTASNAFGSQVTVTTTAMGGTSQTIPILETASGAILSFNPTTLTLPATSRGSPVSYQVVNSGNVAASVSLSLNNPGPSTLTLNAPTSGSTSSGSPLQGSVTESVISTMSSTASVMLATLGTTVLCQPLPSPMAVAAK